MTESLFPDFGNIRLILTLPSRIRELVAKVKANGPLDTGDDLAELLGLLGLSLTGQITDKALDGLRDGDYQTFVDAVVETLTAIKPYLPGPKPKEVRFGAVEKSDEEFLAELESLFPIEKQTATPEDAQGLNPIWISIGFQLVKFLLSRRRSR
jgi:hypothetical protein